MNTRTQGIIIMVVSITILGVVYFAYTQKISAPVVLQETGTTTQSASSQATSQIPSVSGVSKSASQVTPRDLWSTFALYLSKARDHDITGVAELSYVLSGTCKDPKTKQECFAKMDAVYNVGSKLTQEDFIHVWQDGKQAIVSTDIHRPDTTNTLIAVKAIIFFTKDAKGNPKLLSLNPNEMWQVARNKASTTAELESALASLIKDTDEDGVTDQIENCVLPENLINVSCKKTNPNKKDSLGDGWWDGIRPLIAQ